MIKTALMLFNVNLALILDINRTLITYQWIRRIIEDHKAKAIKTCSCLFYWAKSTIIAKVANVYAVYMNRVYTQNFIMQFASYGP